VIRRKLSIANSGRLFWRPASTEILYRLDLSDNKWQFVHWQGSY
jgi:hypothetical protein